ncbi:ABC transporter substrate-binding protein [Geobacillus thermocatenulatus]|uniref:ABC transporter substrate-binding protein n=1 Tax=Geobacillus thermocatenulatus TaxID=33938 RepID=A0A226QCC5_9BACL|nr:MULTISPECIES: ABC transporter substrate-binding protein [Geobacillus]ASS99251.1 ABC transporter substrate-binding protein [Geobacillus thermocatenulatus]KLR73305.1 glycerol-3-phosphate ABC transporter substrate-binding protein [Geobacillus sp. T6]OXB89985.1 ABC transporter substrate-binding protein [Geobacillus thermocatenulatus]
MRKVLASFLTLMFIGLAAGCSNEDASKAAGGKTEVVFWHSMSGDLEPVLNDIVADFNQTHPEIEVKPVFQGTYEEALTKWNAVAGTKDAPTIMQTFEVGTKHMIDSGKVVPVQTWIDKDKYDVSQWEKNIVNYYTVNGRIYSMPFNSSTPVLIYNKDAFREAGLDPEKPPLTYSELKEAAKKLTKKKGKETERYGFSILNYGWFFEEMVAVQGGLYVNNNNGRSGDATKAVFNGDEGKRVFELIRDMYRDGTFYNVGQNWDDMRAAFQAGKIAMYLDSSAGVKTLIDNSPFEVGVSYLPVPDGVERQGVIIGGASLWMVKGSSEEEQKAAWEFMKYLTTAPVQAKWHVRTGYFAINPAAYDEPLVKDEWAKYPQLKVTVDQLHETKSTPATQGALITVFPESRQHVVKAMERLYEGIDPQEALDQAAEETNRALQGAGN